MIALSDITVKYGDRHVLCHTSFQASRGSLTIIEGKSGSGKSTLVDVLLFKHPCQYEYEGKKIIDGSTFILRNVSVVFQQPLLDYDLTMSENRNVIKELHKLCDERKDLLERLGLSALENKYPLQLSGGERTRFAIYLALLKEPDIFILDEPTAYLDSDWKKEVTGLLKEYSADHIVICTTHDKALAKAGDVIYKIENSTLVSNITRDDICVAGNCPEAEKIDFSAMAKAENTHKRVLVFSKRLFLTVVIVFLFISLSLNNTTLNRLQATINGMGSTEFIIFLPLLDDSGNAKEYSFVGVEFPIQEEMVDKIRQVKELTDISYRIDLAGTAWSYEFEFSSRSEYDYFFNLQNNQTLILYDNDDDKGHIDHLQYHVSTYSEAMLEKNNDVKMLFSDEGVLVSNRLWVLMGGNDQLEKPMLEMTLPIPIQDVANNMDMGRANLVNTYFIRARLPVRGVLKDHRFGISYASEQIILPIEYWDSYIKKYKERLNIPQKQILYYVEAEDRMYSEQDLPQYLIDEGYLDRFAYGHDSVEVLTEWKPNAYTAYVQDIGKITETADILRKLGFEAMNEYIDVQMILNVEKTLKRLMITLSSLAFLIVFGGFVMVHLIERIQRATTLLWLRSLGLERNDLKKYQNAVFWRNTWIQMVLGIVAYECVRLFLTFQSIAYIQPDIRTYAGICIVCALIEFWLPSLLGKKAL